MIFSVVGPFRDEEHFIERCILAFLDQTFDKQPYELIFVDDGSTDRSANIVRNYQDITILSESYPDTYEARNRGLKAARGQFIALTNADCGPARRWPADV